MSPLLISKKKFTIAIITVVVAMAVVLSAWFFSTTSTNYAKETAKPIEQALIRAGAVKKCESGDTGRGPDNQSPWYHAIYEMSGSKDEAAGKLISVAQDNGYRLLDDSQSVNAEDRLYLGDRESKKSPYADLEEGSIQLLVTVYSSQTFAENSNFCSIKKKSTPNGKTIFDITLALPEYK